MHLNNNMRMSLMRMSRNEMLDRDFNRASRTYNAGLAFMPNTLPKVAA